jgi:hypothetical protein
VSDPLPHEQLLQIEAVVRRAVREEFAEAGLRLDDASHQDEAKEDFRFVRRFRKGVEGAAGKVGMAVILAVTSGFLYLVVQGFKLFGGK